CARLGSSRPRRGPSSGGLSLDLTATVPDIVVAMRTAGGLESSLATGAFGDTSPDTAEAVVAEAARFAGEVLAPLNRVGDASGVRLVEGKVATAPGFAAAYRQWAA